MFRFSNKNKLAINFIALLTLGLLASSIVAYKHVKEWQEQAIQNDLQLKASLVSTRLNNWVQQALNHIDHFAIFIATSNKPLREHQLYQSYIEQHPKLDKLEYLSYALESDGYFGIFDWEVPEGYDPRQRPWYVEGKKANRPNFGHPFISVEKKPRTLFSVTAPITVKGHFMGLASAQIPLIEIQANLRAAELGVDGEAFLIDNLGKIIVDTDNNKTDSYWPEFTRIVKGDSSMQLIESSDKLFFTLKQDTELDWQLVLSIPRETIERELLNGTLTILGKFLIIFIAVMFGMYLTNRHLLKPLFDYMELDSVTLLPDKKHFKRQVINESLLPNKTGYLLIINMEDFSRHTATYPAAQIHLLQNEIKERIRAQLPNQAILGSFSESRYIVYCDADCNAEQVETVCQKLLNKLSIALTTQYKIALRDINCSFRIGASCYPEHGIDIEALIDSAFSALANVSKYQGQNYGLFSLETNQQFSDELVINSAIKNAIGSNEFTMVYQPQIDSRTNEMIAMEALIRWPSKELKRAVSPVEFIPIAERSDLIVLLGDYVIDSVLKQINLWNQQDVDYGYVSINISPKQLLKKDFYQKLKRSVAKHKVAPEQIELEITEMSVLENPLATIEVLQKLKADGFSIAIDDFGTGYSSLQYLNMMPIDKLKIDRTFIVDLDQNEKTAILVKTIIAMATNLKIAVLAEGVERGEEANALDDFGCYFIQGYLYSKPLTPAAVIPFTQGHKLKLPANN